MKVFVLPSWYPSERSPTAGVFVREQVAAMAALRPSWRIAVGHWGGHDGALSLRDAGASLRALAWRLRAEPGQSVDAGGWSELCCPRLSWTLLLRGGGAAGQLAASRHNLRRARDHLGGVDLIHAHVGFPAGWIASVLAAETGVPYVITEHMSPFPVPQLLRDGRPAPALRQAYAGAAATLAVGPALADRIRACGLPCSDVVPNVVDETRFLAAPIAPVAPRTERPLVLLTLAALRPQKGVDLLLRSLAAWNPSPGRVVLHIAGDGPERASLQALANELGVADRVQWLGALSPSEVPRRQAQADAFVLASRHETFGVVVAEALMCGRPVLATRCGGPEALVGDGDGLLVPADDVPALADGLERLVSSLPGFDAAAIRRRALARFSRAAVVDALEPIYRRVLARRIEGAR